MRNETQARTRIARLGITRLNGCPANPGDQTAFTIDAISGEIRQRLRCRHQPMFGTSISNQNPASTEADVADRKGRCANASPWVTWAGALVVLSFCLVFMWPWWNHYLGVTNEGWFHWFGLQILQGRVPYRDFYLHVPPGQALSMAALIAMFGNRIVVGEMFGLVAALCLSLALYLWLQRILPAFWSVVAVITGMAIYLDTSAESLAGVHLVSILYPVLAFLAASVALDSASGAVVYLFLAGLLAGVSLLTKQTAGVATTVSLGVVLPAIILARGQRWYAIRAAILFAIGWLIPVVSICAWLASHGALRSFLSDAFLRGPSSKGSLTSLLGRQLIGIAGDYYLRICAVLAIGAILLIAFVYRRGSEANPSWPLRSTMWAILTVGVISTGAVVAVDRFGAFPYGLQRAGIVWHNVPLFFGEMGSLILLLGYGWLFLSRRLSWLQEQYLMASAVSFAYSFLCSFSWANAAEILLPAFPFVFAFALSNLRSNKAGRFVQVATLFMVLFCLITMTGLKLQSPYAWADWREGNVRKATVAPNFPELRGIEVTPETERFLERAVADIQENSLPDQPVAEFCCMPILYLLTHRLPATFADVHYIDVTPDSIYRADEEIIEKTPPAVVVTVERSEEEIREGEVYFRGGKPSGERALWAVLRNLEPEYRLADTLATPNTNKRVEVWVKRKP